MKNTINHEGCEITYEEYNRNLLRAFFSTFKVADEHLQFVLLTGVTKFSQVSVFSDFNQPSDISMAPKYEALCGITIDEMAKHYRCSKDGMIAMLKKQYDGYLFSDLMQGVFNPYSLLNTFQKLDIRDYCF